MRVNEENFTTGNHEDVEPSYVEQVVGNHDANPEAHPDIRKQIAETQAFYQGTKDSVQGVAEVAQKAANDAGSSAQVASDAAIAAVSAKDAALQAEDAVKNYYPHIIDGEWFLFNEEEGCLAPSGVMATGPKGEQGNVGPPGEKGETGAPGTDGYNPVRGVDYWTDDDQEKIVAEVLAALPAAEEVAY